MTASTHDRDLREAERLRDSVREHYGAAATAAAQGAASSCCGPASSCCGPTDVTLGDPVTSAFGAALYDVSDRDTLPEAALLASLGCGNPTALAELHPGEVVLDLGSGGGIDVLLSARRVGPTGRAYGVDMTPQMHELALRNRDAAGVTNAEFLLGTIEDVPLPDGTVDVVISNCVVNLSADKPAVLREAFRVLRPGGRLAISDIVLARPLPGWAEGLVALWTGCVAGALPADTLRRQLADAGFTDVDLEVTRVYDRAELADLAGSLDPSDLPAGLDLDAALAELDGVITSSFVRARTP